jgi:hypothetical protein
MCVFCLFYNYTPTFRRTVLEMTIVYSSETAASTYKCTRHPNPEDQSRQFRRYEKLKI